MAVPYYIIITVVVVVLILFASLWCIIYHYPHKDICCMCLQHIRPSNKVTPLNVDSQNNMDEKVEGITFTVSQECVRFSKCGSCKTSRA